MEAKKRAAKGARKTRRRSTIRLDAKVQTVSDLRAEKVLSMFAEHFLKMARCSNENRAYPQAYMYLLLAGNMATLLEDKGHSDNASEYRRQIIDLNIASRGGVQDMLGSSWTINESHDLMPSTPSVRGSNWELQPVPLPPKNPSPVTTVDLHISRAELVKGTGRTLQSFDKPVISPVKSSPPPTTANHVTAEIPKTDTPKVQSIVISTDDEEESTDL